MENNHGSSSRAVSRPTCGRLVKATPEKRPKKKSNLTDKIGHLFPWLVATSLLPPAFDAPPCLRGYKPRPQYWDLPDSTILLTVTTAFAQTKVYYVQPTKPSNRVVVAYHGNTRAAGACMKEIWTSLGDDVHLFLPNLPGYGSFDEDRSDQIPIRHMAFAEAYLKAVVGVLAELLDRDRIEWAALDPVRVEKVGGERLQTKPCRGVEGLPGSFREYQKFAFGRSVGAFCAAAHREWPRILYVPLLSLDWITPAGWRGVAWWLLRPFSPFLDRPNDNHRGLAEVQLEWVRNSPSRVCTGFDARRDVVEDLDRPGGRCLVIYARHDRVLSKPDRDFIRRTREITDVHMVDGDHDFLPDDACRELMRDFLNCE